MEKIYVIGITPFAQMLRFYIEDAGVDCFGGYVVDEKYMPENGKIGGIEVISWETFTSTVSPDSCKILSSVTYNGMNKVREIMYHRIKNAGYTMANFIHPSAVVARNCDMGEGNIFLENVTVQPFTKIGNNNVFWSNVNICHHTVKRIVDGLDLLRGIGLEHSAICSNLVFQLAEYGTGDVTTFHGLLVHIVIQCAGGGTEH